MTSRTCDIRESPSGKAWQWRSAPEEAVTHASPGQSHANAIPACFGNQLHPPATQRRKYVLQRSSLREAPLVVVLPSPLLRGTAESGLVGSP